MAGRSVDCNCTGTKGHVRGGARRADAATAIAISLDPLRGQGPLQTSRGLCPCTRGLRVPVNARATRTSTDQDTNERPVRQNSTATKLHLNITIRQYPPPQKLGGSGGEDVGKLRDETQPCARSRLHMATQPNRKKNCRPNPSPKGNLATDKRRGNERKDVEESRKQRKERDKKEEIPMPDTILRRRRRRCTAISVRAHTIVQTRRDSDGRLSNNNRVARRILETPGSLHRDRCGTSIVFNTSEGRWNSFRDATEILTLCTLRHILEPVLQHLSSVLLKSV